MLKLSAMPSGKHIFLPLVVGGVIFVIAVLSFMKLQTQYHERLAMDFQSRLGSVHQSIITWSLNKKVTISSWANQPELTRLALPLIRHQEKIDEEVARAALDRFLRPVVSDPEISAYYLVGAGNQVLASNKVDQIGQVSALAFNKNAINRAWRGVPVLTAPQFIHSEGNHSQQFVVAGIRGGKNLPIALLVFEVMPDTVFFSLLEKAAFGDTGESYIFDDDGLLLSPSRFSDQRLYIRVAYDNSDAKIQPLTLLAQSALAHHSGSQVNSSYIGYSGSHVIGAWLWDDQLKIGLAVEQGADEGLLFLDNLQMILIIFTCTVFLLCFSFLSYVVYHSNTRAAEESRARKELIKQLEELHQEKTTVIAEKEARHRAIIDTAWDAIFAVDDEGVIQSLNPSVGRIFGRSSHEYLGSPLADILRINEKEYGFDRGILSRHHGQSFEAIGIRYDGSYFPVAVSSSRTTSNQNSFYTVVLRDISKQKKNEEDIRAIRHRLELSQAFASIGTWEWSLKTDKVAATDMAMTLLGINDDVSQVTLSFFFSHLAEDDIISLRQEINQAIAENRAFNRECRLKSEVAVSSSLGKKNESHEWLLIQGTPILENEVTQRIVGHIQKITHQKKNEAELENARNMLSLVLDTIPSGVYWKDSSLRVAGINSQFSQDVGLAAEDIIGKTDFEIYNDPDQAALIDSSDRNVFETLHPKLREQAFYRMNDGQRRDIEISRLPIKNSSNNPVGVLGVYSDITERVEAQENLYRHHRLLASIYSTQLRYFSHASKTEIFSSLLDEVLSLTDSEYGFIGQCCYTPEQQIYLRTFAITDISWDKEIQALYQERLVDGFEFFNLDTLFGLTLKTAETVISNEPGTDPRAGGLPKGHPPLKAYLGVPLMKGDEMVGMIGIANREDGYDRELVDFLRPMLTTCSNLIVALRSDEAIEFAQQQLINAKTAAEKASLAKTEFLSRMSHELRTPMNAILGFANLLKETVKDDLESTEFAQEIEKAGKHLMSLINEVLDLERIESGRIELEITSVDLADIVEECCTVIEPVAQRFGISLINDVDKTMSYYARADAVRLRQVLLNLISNGIKYNSKKGSVTISVIHGSEGYSLSVADTGVGIAFEEQEHLFESFNRLHAEGSDIEGTGMGLVISKRLTELMHGQMTFESEQGVGSKFYISLPFSDESSVNSGKTIGYLEGKAANVKKVLFATHETSVAECCSELEPELLAQDVYFVSTAMGFLEQALQNDYQLLIVDEKINDIPLSELIEYLRDAAVLDKIEIIVLLDSNWLKDSLVEQGIKLHLRGNNVGNLVSDALGGAV